MTDQMLIVFGILAGAVVLFAWGRPRADLVAILVVLALMVSRVLTPQESLAGFGDPVVLLIAAIFIVGKALANTRVAHRLGEVVLKAGGGDETRLIVLLMLLVGGIGAFMSSSAIVAMFIPVVLLSAQRTAEDAGTRAPSASDLIASYGLTTRWHRLRVPPGSPLIHQSVVQMRPLYDRFGVVLVGVEKHPRGHTQFLPALPETGATVLMANALVTALGPLGPVAMLMVVFLVTALVGLFLSNSATAVLIAPVAIEAAQTLHVSPQAFAMTVAIACCAAYVTPVSSPVNMLVMDPAATPSAITSRSACRCWC
jgi:di/tricarboxylate transporter